MAWHNFQYALMPGSRFCGSKLEIALASEIGVGEVFTVSPGSVGPVKAWSIFSATSDVASNVAAGRAAACCSANSASMFLVLTPSPVFAGAVPAVPRGINCAGNGSRGVAGICSS